MDLGKLSKQFDSFDNLLYINTIFPPSVFNNITRVDIWIAGLVFDKFYYFTVSFMNQGFFIDKNRRARAYKHRELGCCCWFQACVPVSTIYPSFGLAPRWGCSSWCMVVKKEDSSQQGREAKVQACYKIDEAYFLFPGWYAILFAHSISQTCFPSLCTCKALGTIFIFIKNAEW